MEPALAIFAPLLAKCFAATLSAGVLDRHCFSAVYGEAHVRDTHVVTTGGKAVYSGETIYSFDGKGLEFTYFNGGRPFAGLDVHRLHEGRSVKGT